MRRLEGSHGVVRVDDEVRGVNVVALEHHFHDLWLVDGAFLHEVDDLVLVVDGMVDVVVKLYLDLVLQLTGLVHEVLVLRYWCEVFTILSEEVELSDVRPGEVAVTHRVHRPDADVLAAAQQVHLVDLAVKRLPVLGERHPGEAVASVEDRESDLPLPHERVDEEDVPAERHGEHVGAVGVLHVDLGVLDVVARPEKHLTLTVELKRLGWLVDLVGTLEVLCGALSQFSLRGVDNLVQVINLFEATLGGLHHSAG